MIIKDFIYIGNSFKHLKNLKGKAEKLSPEFIYSSEMFYFYPDHTKETYLVAAENLKEINNELEN